MSWWNLFPKITPVAAYESQYLARLFAWENQKEAIQYPIIAQTVSTSPRIATAGLPMDALADRPHYTPDYPDYGAKTGSIKWATIPKSDFLCPLIGRLFSWRNKCGPLTQHCQKRLTVC